MTGIDMNALKEALDVATPGPWRVGNRYVENGVWTKTGENVASTHSAQRNFERDAQIAEQDANAALIAMAPALAEALLKAWDVIHAADKMRLDAAEGNPLYGADYFVARAAFLECLEAAE